MEFQQIYNEDDIKTIHKILHENKKLKSLFFVNLIYKILFVILFLIFAWTTHFLSDRLIFFAGGIVFYILFDAIYKFFVIRERKTEAYKTLRKQYVNPVFSRIEDDYIMFRDKKYYYDNISYIIYYDKYIFIFGAGKIIPFIYNQEMNQLIQEKVQQYSHIKCIHKKEPFSVDYYDKLS